MKTYTINEMVGNLRRLAKDSGSVHAWTISSTLKNTSSHAERAGLYKESRTLLMIAGRARNFQKNGKMNSETRGELSKRINSVANSMEKHAESDAPE